MKMIRYWDTVMMQTKEDDNLTKAEYNARMLDLRIMELGGKVSDISSQDLDDFE